MRLLCTRALRSCPRLSQRRSAVLLAVLALSSPSWSQERCERLGRFTGDADAVHTAFFGPLRIDAARGPNGIVPFRIADCDNDNLADLAID